MSKLTIAAPTESDRDDWNRLYHGYADPSCGHHFVFKTKLELKAGTNALLKKDIKDAIVTKKVNKILFHRHKKPGKRPTFKVTYVCGNIDFYNEWIAFEHDGYPKQKAQAWWRKLGQGTCPLTVQEALSRTSQIRKPKSITVDRFDKYPKVIQYEL